MRRRPLLLLLAVALLATATGVAAGMAVAASRTSERAASREAADRPCGRAYVTLLPERRGEGKTAYRLERVGRADQPTTMALAPDDSGNGVIGQREGLVVAIDAGAVTDRVVLDLSDDTQDEGDGGLLGLAYDPDGAWLYVYRADRARDEVVTAYPLRDGAPVQGDEVVVLHIDHPPSEQHHGGGFAFGPDGFLYIGTGDGGGLGDPRRNAQDGGELLGKVLRIDPTPGAPEPYAVPADNPFVERDGWRPEIWALGVRNPFRLSFDAATGELWVADVGQSCWEELDRLPAGAGGANLGWDRREGTHVFQGGDVPGAAVDPVQAYSHRGGWCAVVGGFVVRGDALPTLEGWYLHTDYCRGRLMAFRPATGDDPPRLLDLAAEVARPVAIVPGPDGLPWVLGLTGDVWRVLPR